MESSEEPFGEVAETLMEDSDGSDTSDSDRDDDEENFFDLYADDVDALGYLSDGQGRVETEFSTMEDVIKKEFKDQKSKSALNAMLRNSRRKLNASLKVGARGNRRRIFRKMFRSPIDFQSKVTFVCGVLGSFFVEYVLFAHRSYFPQVTSLLMLFLIVLRFIMYKRQKFQYFMLDFCYFVHLLILFYIFIYPSPVLFPSLFVLSNGPLAMGLILWRNSLVFHDTDKMTSVALHLTPPLITYVIRWYPEGRILCLYDCQLGFLYLFVMPTLLYAFWQLCYYMKVFLIDSKVIESDPEISFSYRYNAQNTTGLIHRLIRVCGLQFTVFSFLFSQMVYTEVTFLITPLFFFNQYAHALWILFNLYYVAHSGASYYFDVFARLQHEKILRRKERMRLRRDNRNSLLH